MSVNSLWTNIHRQLIFIEHSFWLQKMCRKKCTFVQKLYAEKTFAKQTRYFSSIWLFTDQTLERILCSNIPKIQPWHGKGIVSNQKSIFIVFLEWKTRFTSMFTKVVTCVEIYTWTINTKLSLICFITNDSSKILNSLAKFTKKLSRAIPQPSQ